MRRKQPKTDRLDYTDSQKAPVRRGFFVGEHARVDLVTVVRPPAVAVRVVLAVDVRWLYPISAFFLAAERLIETDYLIVPFALRLAMREHRHHAIERATLALRAALAVLIVAGTVSGPFFP